MKKILSLCVLTCLPLLSIAAPTMSVITVNTENYNGYMDWARKSAEVIGNANGALGLGVCRTTAGAEVEGDLYYYAMSESMEKMLQGDVNVGKVAKEIAKMKVERTVQTRDMYRILKTGSGSAEVGQINNNMNILIRTNDIASYIEGLGQLEAAYHDNDFKDITLQAFLSESGDYTGLVMTSLSAPTRARLGAALDARSEPWAASILSSWSGKREYVRGIFMDCETLFVAD
ncbi:MAG: hypothetical protein HOJ61_03380 [Gammaproteobacteria bacterium]|nr:hypothetical protein [Gammaproteobacteria bacterium]MBT5601252.1 hypothetical protein [Gammaproteobacteria bacterium]MBT6245681.1 hypothetical protein [Gammaproteobacteria bacterium]